METKVKHSKFEGFHSLQADENYSSNNKRVINCLKESENKKLKKEDEIVFSELKKIFLTNNGNVTDFKLSKVSNAEINQIEDENLLIYLIHRYRYEIYPKEKILSTFPPYLQIEPTSICNFRCVFCYQKNKNFYAKSNGHMGHMELELLKKIVDQAEDNIHMISIASRGEPTLYKHFIEMLDYISNKFLVLKINTNASLLNEEKIHAILRNRVSTLVFSADAADEELYKKLRVNGSLKVVLKNIELFNKIKDTHYKNSKIITRVSGVKVSKQQKNEDMIRVWNGLVQQVAFVNYVPTENVYDLEENYISEPCSDLWRRMFVWWNGIANPCEIDFLSNLSVGNINNYSLEELWNHKAYSNYRELHQNKNRKQLNPCSKCQVT